MKTPKILYDACEDGKEYFATQNTLKSAWFNCKRPDWMLWALTEIGYKDDKNLRLFSCKCACDTPLSDGRHTYELLTDQRSIDAIEVSIRYVYVKATREELESVCDAARATARAARDAAGAERDAASAAQAEYLRQFIDWEDVDKYIKSKL